MLLYSIIFGLLLAVATIAIHAVGTTWWIWRLENYRKRVGRDRPETFFECLRVLCSTAVALLTVHICEIVVWAFAYLILVYDGAMDKLEEAVYFSTVTFAALGYGDIVIEGDYRMLSAIQAMTGLLVVGWSTALLFTILQRMGYKLRDDDKVQRDGRRGDSWHD